jgi:ribosomal protein S18 acetylase RimI-like enzyme
MSVQIESELARTAETLATVQAGLRQYNSSYVPREEYVDLTIVARDDRGEVVGAVLGETGRGWLHVDVVWVDERFRRQRIGSQLIEAAEAEAIRRGCHGAYLDTFSYQAKPFYEKLGYSVFGTLDDYPRGHQRFYMRKRLGV